MRDFKNMKRQRGRNRGGGMGGANSGGGKPQQNANRAFDSNGPDNVKIRGHAQHVFEKYQQLARDAFSSGDRVVAENYLQHADHYFRVLRTLQPQRSPSEILGRDSLASNIDIDFEEEFDQAEEQAEAAADAPQEMNGEAHLRQDGRRDERYEGRRDGFDARDTRSDRFEPRRDGEGQSRDQGQYRDQGQGRDQGQARDQGQPRDQGSSRDQGQYREQPQYRDRPDRDRQDNRDRPDNRDRQEVRDRPENRERFDNRERSQPQPPRDRGEIREGQDRADRSDGRRDNRRFEGRREDRPFNRDGAREGRFEERRPDAAPADPLPVVAPEAAIPMSIAPADAEGSPVLRSHDGAMSEAPAFLQPVGGEEGEVRKARPRRRRAPRSFEASGDGDAPASLAEAEDA